jgi:pyruvate formate-lyase/glycerol dehydratase family glycyl radical enzyme
LAGTSEVLEETAVPWWERSVTYRKMWRGVLFDRMILRGDEEEQRIQRLRDRILQRPNGKRGFLSIWRAKLTTDSYRETEGETPIIRRAKAFKHICERIPIPIPYDDQLLFGSPSACHLGVEIEPEFMTNWLEREIFVEEAGKTMNELDALSVRGVESWNVSEQDFRLLKSYILPYWRQITHEKYIEKQLQENFPYVHFEEGHFVGRASYPAIGQAINHTVADYASVLKKGLKRIKEEIKIEMEEIDPSDVPCNSDLERISVYKAMLTCADGIITYANRCADLAEDMMAKETDSKRKSELTEIARVCRKVPEYPAGTWWEALQSWHFLHNAIRLTDGGVSHSAGRFDQYMYPYLKNDLESGKITKEMAQFLLECLFIKCREFKYLLEYRGAKRIVGFHSNDKMNLSGVDSEGKDATNDLTYMLLEAQAHVHLDEPVVAVRMHKNTPDDLLKRTLELLRLGSGIPHILNDEAIIPGLLSRGVTMVEARNYADIGCQECVTDPNTCGADTNPRSNAGWFNLAKIVELALFDGVDPLSGEQCGPKTGDPRDFKSMDEFFDAYKKQLDYAVKVNCVYNNLMDWMWANWYPAPMLDLLHTSPRSKGIDYMNGGCKYNWTGALGLGVGTCADSLAAIEYLVYDKKEITIDQLIKALESNWVAYENIREKCASAPKYGNDDDYADKWARKATSAWMDAYESHRTPKGGTFLGGFASMTTYAFIGSETGATPDGRRKREPLSSGGIDPCSGVDLKGPTALHKSAAKIDTWRTTNGITFNCKFNTTTIMSERELSKWADLVRMYILLKGQSVQYTIVDREALIDAQRHPEKYKDLIVRTGGYSAVFVELSKEVQDTIIARTEHLV